MGVDILIWGSLGESIVFAEVGSSLAELSSA